MIAKIVVPPVVPDGTFYPMPDGKALEKLLGELRVWARGKFQKVWAAINTHTDEIADLKEALSDLDGNTFPLLNEVN